MSDSRFMRKALSLASRGKGLTSPNPCVGAVVEKGGQIISADYHRKAGTPHAELLALKKAGSRARNATLYVNLEPCCHTDKRTPPCTDAIIHSGIKRVVVAMIDPNPKVSGKGMYQLRNSGIDTELGIMKEEAEKLNESFSKFIRTGMPFGILKMAQTLDGKIATVTGESKWITSSKSRELVQRLRSEVDAVLVGIGTIKKDDPSLDCRIAGKRNPLRIIVDSSLHIPLSSCVLRHGDEKTIIATTEGITSKKSKQLKNMGAIVLKIQKKGDGVNLFGLMKSLGAMGITSVMIEGGSSIAASALSHKIIDKVLFFIAPKIIGGVDSIASVGGMSPSNLKNAIHLKNMRTRRVGEDLLVEGYV